jgi:hypothetical protein
LQAGPQQYVTTSTSRGINALARSAMDGVGRWIASGT